MPRWFPNATGDHAAGVYGTLLTLSVLVGLSVEQAGAAAMVVTVAVSVSVFWLAHVHAHLVAGWIRPEARPGHAAVRATMRSEAPLVGSALPVLVLLTLAWIGLIGLSFAVWASFGYGVAALVGWGVLMARRARLGRTGVLLVAGVNLALGGLIVLLKVLVH